jgi:NADH-quinone oxidoreductase subunit G
VLRVLGNLLGLRDFEYLSSEQVRDELRREIDGFRAPDQAATDFAAGHLNGVDKVAGTGIYRVDAVVRRSRPLQETRAGRAARGADA